MVGNLPLAPDEGWEALYLNGEWTSTGDRETFDDENPATREVITPIPAGTTDDVDAAYDAAAAAQEEWAERPPQARAAVVADAVEYVGAHEDEIRELIAVEAGGSAVKSRIELDIATGMMREAAGFPNRAQGTTADSVIPGKENTVKREPVGVVTVISPWNFPLHLSMRAVAPAIALGNAVVLKPASATPITGGLLLARIFEEAGLPPGVLNVVPGSGSDIGDRVASHPDSEVVAFTGSTAVGRGVAKLAAENLALPAMELGGNNAHIVTENADLDAAVDAGSFGTFAHQGQVCISINRHLVHENHYDEYVERLAERAESLPMGDPSEDPDVVIGPVIDENQRDTMLELVEKSVEAGATVEAGGDHDELFVEPTVLSDVTNDMPVAAEEHFGPIAPVIPFADEEEAIELANGTEYGLSGSVHSRDRSQARRIADAVDTGMVHINDQPINDEPHVPFGGEKGSGMGRYNGRQILEELTTLKWISEQREPREYPF